MVASSTAHAQSAIPHLRIVVPSGPGGAWDLTARVLQPILQSEGLAGTTVVENIAGAGGVVGLTRFAMAERGVDNVVMLLGNGVIGSALSSASVVTLANITPIARLTSECEVFIVPSASPHQTMSDLVAAFRAAPERMSWGVGGPAGTDATAAWLVADAVSVDPRRVNIIAVAGGGEVMRVVLGNQVTVGVNPLTPAAPYVTTGAVRALAVSCAERVTGLDVPTLRETGIDVEIEVWRALVAPPGITVADRERLENIAARLVRSQAWREALARHDWRDRFLAGPAFAQFLADEQATIRALVRRVAANDNRGPTVEPYPAVIVVATVVTAIVFVRQRRRRQTSAVESPGAGWPAVGMVAAGSVLSVMLIERVGFVAAATALFWTTARAFDRRRPSRDAVLAIGLAATAYVVFARWLELPLPAGILERWL